MGGCEELLANCRLAQKVLCDCSEIDLEMGELHLEIEVVAELSRKAISENAYVAINQDEWYEHSNGYLERHRKASERVTELEGLKRERRSKNHTLESFIRNIETRGDTLEEFDERLWMVASDKVTVMPDGRLVFSLRHAAEIGK